MNYEELLREFVEKCGIDLTNLSSFMIEDVEDFEAQTERYPFDDFDDAYYKLYEKESLEEMLFAYIRQNLEDFSNSI